MKNLIFIGVTFIICFNAKAQRDTLRNPPYPPDINKSEEADRKFNSNRGMNDNPDSMRNQMQRSTLMETYRMKNGKMVVYKDGKMTTMEKDINLSNGTVIMKNGYFMKRNGTKIKLKEGEHLDMMGQLIPSK